WSGVRRAGERTYSHLNVCIFCEARPLLEKQRLTLFNLLRCKCQEKFSHKRHKRHISDEVTPRLRHSLLAHLSRREWRSGKDAFCVPFVPFCGSVLPVDVHEPRSAGRNGVRVIAPGFPRYRTIRGDLDELE